MSDFGGAEFDRLLVRTRRRAQRGLEWLQRMDVESLPLHRRTEYEEKVLRLRQALRLTDPDVISGIREAAGHAGRDLTFAEVMAALAPMQ